MSYWLYFYLYHLKTSVYLKTIEINPPINYLNLLIFLNFKYKKINSVLRMWGTMFPIKFSSTFSKFFGLPKVMLILVSFVKSSNNLQLIKSTQLLRFLGKIQMYNLFLKQSLNIYIVLINLIQLY